MKGLAASGLGGAGWMMKLKAVVGVGCLLVGASWLAVGLVCVCWLLVGLAQKGLLMWVFAVGKLFSGCCRGVFRLKCILFFLPPSLIWLVLLVAGGEECERPGWLGCMWPWVPVWPVGGLGALWAAAELAKGLGLNDPTRPGQGSVWVLWPGFVIAVSEDIEKK